MPPTLLATKLYIHAPKIVKIKPKSAYAKGITKTIAIGKLFDAGDIEKLIAIRTTNGMVMMK